MKVLTDFKGCHGGRGVSESQEMVIEAVENIIEDACEEKIEKITGSKIELDGFLEGSAGLAQGNTRVIGTAFIAGVVLSRLVSHVCCCGFC